MGGDDGDDDDSALTFSFVIKVLPAPPYRLRLANIEDDEVEPRQGQDPSADTVLVNRVPLSLCAHVVDEYGNPILRAEWASARSVWAGRDDATSGRWCLPSKDRAGRSTCDLFDVHPVLFLKRADTEKKTESDLIVVEGWNLIETVEGWRLDGVRLGGIVGRGYKIILRDASAILKASNQLIQFSAGPPHRVEINGVDVWRQPSDDAPAPSPRDGSGSPADGLIALKVRNGSRLPTITVKVVDFYGNAVGGKASGRKKKGNAVPAVGFSIRPSIPTPGMEETVELRVQAEACSVESGTASSSSSKASAISTLEDGSFLTYFGTSGTLKLKEVLLLRKAKSPLPATGSTFVLKLHLTGLPFVPHPSRLAQSDGPVRVKMVNLVDGRADLDVEVPVHVLPGKHCHGITIFAGRRADSQLVLPASRLQLTAGERLPLFRIVAVAEDGSETTDRIPAEFTLEVSSNDAEIGTVLSTVASLSSDDGAGNGAAETRTPGARLHTAIVFDAPKLLTTAGMFSAKVVFTMRQKSSSVVEHSLSPEEIVVPFEVVVAPSVPASISLFQPQVRKTSKVLVISSLVFNDLSVADD